MATSIVTGRSLGIQICEAVGIPTDCVTHVSIDLRTDCMASVIVERAICHDEAGKIIEALQQYELCERQAQGE